MRRKLRLRIYSPEDSWAKLELKEKQGELQRKQDPGTDQWSIRREKDTPLIRELMSTLKELFIDDGIPVLITEFGCADKNNPVQRQAWACYFAP